MNAYIHAGDVRIIAEIQAYTYFSAVQSVVLAGRIFICLYKLSPEDTHGLMDYLMSALTLFAIFRFMYSVYSSSLFVDGRKSRKNSSQEHTAISCIYISTYTGPVWFMPTAALSKLASQFFGVGFSRLWVAKILTRISEGDIKWSINSQIIGNKPNKENDIWHDQFFW
jgi:hypothetical protein